MGSWALRIISATIVAALLAGGAVDARAGVAAPARTNGTSRAAAARCARAILGVGHVGVGHGSARPIEGSADPQLAARFAVLRRARRSTDALPRTTGLRAELAEVGATTYDPAGSLRLRRIGAHGGAYLLPATLSPQGLPAACTGLPGAAGLEDLPSLTTGAGPGLCAVTIRRDLVPAPVETLPGQAIPRPSKVEAVEEADCASTAVLLGYEGALGAGSTGDATSSVLVPDGVATLAYRLASGRTFMARARDGFATVPSGASGNYSLGSGTQLTTAALRRGLSAHLPVTITERGPDGAVVAMLERPATLIPDVLASFRFDFALARAATVGTTQSTDLVGASCRAATHRCVAVTVAVRCVPDRTCRTSRTIHRYRYVGRRPPTGTTGRRFLPTAPIIGRLDRHITHPRKLTLDLTGARPRRVVVIETLSCTSDLLSSGGPVEVRHLAVPSRSAIDLPGPARSLSSCDVGVLVTSSRPGRVGVAVARS